MLKYIAYIIKVSKTSGVREHLITRSIVSVISIYLLLKANDVFIELYYTSYIK